MSAIGDRQGRSGRFGARAVPAALLAAAAIAASTATSAGAQSPPVLPDLVADPATNPTVQTYTDSAGTRWLLRFDGYVHNGGYGAVELRGSAPVSGEMSVVHQRVYDTDGGYVDLTNVPAPRVLFEPADGHNHWHLRNAAAYSLWNSGRTAEVAPSQKVGFCLIDSTRVDDWGGSSAFYTISGGSFCEQNKPEVLEITMGISAGWRDFYHRSLPFQWVDISRVLPGKYSLRSDVDPGGVIAETNEDNQPAFADAVVPGYVATPFSARVSRLLPSFLTLRAEKFGSPSSVQFRIDEAPRHGKLDKPVGEWFDGSTVTYTPKLGYSGPDSFRFSAREKGNDFPLNPRSATVSLGVGTAPLALAPNGQTAEQGTAPVSAQRRAPDVPGPLPAPDGSVLAAPQVSVAHGDLIVRTVARRPGVLRLVAEAGEVTLGACEAAVPADQPHTCLLATGVSADQLRGALVRATLRAGDRLLDSREVRLP